MFAGFAVCNRVSQYVPNFRFFNIFIMRKAHLIPKVLKQANFLQILAKFVSGNLVMCNYFSTGL